MSSYDQRLQARFTEPCSLLSMPQINESLTLECTENIGSYENIHGNNC